MAEASLQTDVIGRGASISASEKAGRWPGLSQRVQGLGFRVLELRVQGSRV